MGVKQGIQCDIMALSGKTEVCFCRELLCTVRYTLRGGEGAAGGLGAG